MSQPLLVEAETPEWTPLFAALADFEERYDRGEGGDQFVASFMAVIEAWKEYRHARFGALSPTHPTPEPPHAR